MAVTRMTGFSGWQSEPPAARLYAVDPVGVATQIPSACTVVKCSSSPKISIDDIARFDQYCTLDNMNEAVILGFGPLSTTTSFNIWYVPSGLCVR